MEIVVTCHADVGNPVAFLGGLVKDFLDSAVVTLHVAGDGGFNFLDYLVVVQVGHGWLNLLERCLEGIVVDVEEVCGDVIADSLCLRI